jgi:hypothetical protein
MVCMVVLRYSVSLLLRSGASHGIDAAREGHLVPMFFLSNSMAFSASASDGNTTLFSQDAHMFDILHTVTCKIHLYPSTISHVSIRLRRYVGTHQGFSGWVSILADLNLHLDRQHSITGNIHGMRSP